MVDSVKYSQKVINLTPELFIKEWKKADIPCGSPLFCKIFFQLFGEHYWEHISGYREIKAALFKVSTFIEKFDDRSDLNPYYEEVQPLLTEIRKHLP